MYTLVYIYTYTVLYILYDHTVLFEPYWIYGCYAFGITLEKGILYPYLCVCVIDLSMSWIYSLRF